MVSNVKLRSLLQAVLCLTFIPHSFFVCHSPVGKSVSLIHIVDSFSDNLIKRLAV